MASTGAARWSSSRAARARTRKHGKRRIRLWPRRKRKKRFKVRKLRVLIVLFFLGVLAAISTAFGMFMALASDLPKLENAPDTTVQSKLLDKNGDEIGILTGNERRIYLREDQIRRLHEAGDRRDRGPPLLDQLAASTCAASRAPPSRTRPRAGRSRAPPRSRSSSSRSRSRPRTTARCSRSCARPRSPTS